MEAEKLRALETNEKESQDYQLEYHNTIWSEHEMEVDGVVLKEKKETTTIRDENQNNLGQSDVKQCTIRNQTLTIHQKILQKWRGSGG